jgi:hypothetical protein
MTPEQLVTSIEEAGGALVVSEGRIRYTLPIRIAPLVDALRANRNAVMDLLERRRQEGLELSLPCGVQLVRWAPKAAPVMLTRWSVVMDTDKFIKATLAQLQAALRHKDWLAGNWSVHDLVDRLEQVGVHIEVGNLDSTN